MFVGTARFVIHIPAARTLKDRRRVVNSLKDRIRARLSVSLCEVGNAERHQLAMIAIATVARESETCRRVIEAARSLAESLPEAMLTDSRSEVLSFGSEGQNLQDGIEALGPFAAGDPGASPDPGVPRRISKKLRNRRVT